MLQTQNKLPYQYRMALMNMPFNFRKQFHPMGLLYRLTSFFEYKNVQTLCCNYHIIGNNPIMELLFIYFLSQNINQKENISVLFSHNSQLDYWMYSEIQNPVFFEKLSEVLETKITNIYEFINVVIRKIPQNNLTIYYHENGLFPHYYRYDSYIKKMILVFHPFEKKQHGHNKDNETSEIVIIDNEVKDKIRIKMNEYIDALGIAKEIKNLYPQEPVKVLSDHTLLTSLPQGWIDSKTFHHQDLLSQEMCFLNFFSENEQAIASAYHISSSLKEAKQLAHQDLYLAKNHILKLVSKHK